MFMDFFFLYIIIYTTPLLKAQCRLDVYVADDDSIAGTNNRYCNVRIGTFIISYHSRLTRQQR